MKIIIIGGGPGGYEAAIRGAQLGAEITLIERKALGGTCLNAGCIPTKSLFKTASVLRTIQKSENFGISANLEGFDMKRILQVKDDTISHLRRGIKDLIDGNDIRFIEGDAQLQDKHHVIVHKATCTEIVFGDYIIIATGSEAILPNIPGIHSPNVMTSKELLNLDQVPESLAIIGAGVIGVEFAGIYKSFGSKVTLLDSGKSILPFLDRDLSKRLSRSLKKDDVDILTNASLEAIECLGNKTRIHYKAKGKPAYFESDKVLISIGRKPRFPKGLDQLQVSYDNKGIHVDENYRTNIDNIYAIGDVNGRLMLAHAASHQGTCVVEHLVLGTRIPQTPVIPSCIFSFPEVATVGLSEEDLKHQNQIYKSSKFSFQHNGKAMTMMATEGYIKVISVADTLVGVQIIGPHASDLIHEATLGIHNQLKVRDYIETVHAHPTLSEVFLEAVRGLENRAIHQVPTKIIKSLTQKTS